MIKIFENYTFKGIDLPYQDESESNEQILHNNSTLSKDLSMDKNNSMNVGVIVDHNDHLISSGD
jgi:hypothetical protein